MTITKQHKEDFMIRIRRALANAEQYFGSEFNTNAVIAQAALESGWGRSGLTRDCNNLFGIKCGSRWTGARKEYYTREEHADGRPYVIVAAFRAYPSWGKCIEDYAEGVMRLPWFKDTYRHRDVDQGGTGSVIGWLEALQNRDPYAYATDTKYVQKVLLHLNELGLSKISK